jgi:hypothetical protein
VLGGSDGGDPGPMGSGDPLTDCQDWIDAGNEFLVFSCMCDVEAGQYPDVETCLQGFDPPDACGCPILAADPANASHLECNALTMTDFAACLAPLACSDQDALVDCLIAYDAVASGCGEATKASLIEAGLACDDAAPFVCGSGESIPSEFVCDGESDCMDMSDEGMDMCF